MSFASPGFLWLFLPAVLVAVLASPRSWRNLVVAAFSLMFYAAGGGAFTLLLLASIVVNFCAGLLVEPAPYRLDRTRRRIAAAAIVTDVGILAFWKYADFASAQIDELSRSVGLDGTRTLSVALPIGISFYTFHQISYVVDVYRGRTPAQAGMLPFITYIGMFPQLIAGPIVRYHEIAPQLAERRANRLDDIVAGFPRFALGLTKKVVVADSLAPVAGAVFDQSTGGVGFSSAWIGVVAYTLQIYFDFSGYSDMAIGLGRMIGFRLPENFERPYSAISVTDFWRRWHMSLSRWFRDYLYIPLGGNRQSTGRTYLNLWIVFLVTGLWHGANWTFVAWGAYHGALLVFERVTGIRTLARRAALPRRALTLVLVMVGWVVFRAHNLHDAWNVLAAMGGAHGFDHDPINVNPAMHAALTHRRAVTLVAAAAVVAIPPTFVLGRYLDAARSSRAEFARVAYSTVGLGYAAILIAAGTFSPFLYYQF
jgi:alginate O-acetyltransferase complex protein AlgI